MEKGRWTAANIYRFQLSGCEFDVKDPAHHSNSCHSLRLILSQFSLFTTVLPVDIFMIFVYARCLSYFSVAVLSYQTGKWGQLWFLGLTLLLCILKSLCLFLSIFSPPPLPSYPLLSPLFPSSPIISYPLPSSSSPLLFSPFSLLPLTFRRSLWRS